MNGVLVRGFCNSVCVGFGVGEGGGDFGVCGRDARRVRMETGQLTRVVTPSAPATDRDG